MNGRTVATPDASTDAPRSRCLAAAAAALAGIAALAAPVPLDAQYFGRNKVIWERFEFEVLESEHFLVHYYPPDAPHAEYVADLAERWYVRLASWFDHELEEKKPLVIYANHADFQQTVITPGLIGEGTGGFTESALDRVVFPLTGINADNDHVIGHELVHVFQFDLMKQLASTGQRPAQLPLWLIEGLAEYLSQGRVDPATAMSMRDAVLHDALPDPKKLIQRQPSPYQYGQAIWAYVAGRWDDYTAARLFRHALETGPADAFRSVLGLDIETFLAEFHAALADAAAPVLDARVGADAAAEPLLTSATTGASVNLAPALSPDGRHVAFLSTRALELELYLADAETGAVLKRLVRAEADRHFQNLSFLDSSVAWSPDGRRVAFGAFARGGRAIVLYDVERGRVERRLDLPGIDDMRQPAWSPDGRSLVFSAVVGTASDLFTVELETGDLTRLTDDGYTDIQPAFSPDGRRIAFVTDRGGGTDLARLAFGDLGIAILDVETRRIEMLPLFARGKHIDPHFSADGRRLYFIAEPDGVPDVFRYDFASGNIERLTRMRTGVSGLTGTSPALSVAAGDTLVFSVLEDGGYNVYRMRAPDGEPAERHQDFSAAVLPPADVTDERSIVERYLRDPDTGRPQRASRPTRDYDPKIRLTALAPAAAGVVSVSGWGGGLAGAVSAYFSDTLNRHQIVATFQGGASASGVLDFEDTLGADVTYLNQTRRFQWGGRVSRIPYLSGATFLSRRNVDVDGTTRPADVVERLVIAEQVTELALLGVHPFSLNSRLEAALGVAGIDFERKLERIVYPFGARPFRETLDLPSPEALDLRQASVAFVRDTSTFGFVSPVRGMRLRIDNQWTTGDLDFRTTRIDYRRYFFRNPLTVAVRLLHLGRRGADAEDPRLSLLDIGSNTLVRGYDLDSFDLSECRSTVSFTACPQFDRLVGSRIAVANLEVRVPLLGTGDFGLFDVPAAPTELAFFIDAGAAWRSGESVDWRFRRNSEERVPVWSAGLAARTVLLGALPLEFFYAHPFQRPDEDAVFGVRFGGGW